METKLKSWSSTWAPKLNVLEATCPTHSKILNDYFTPSKGFVSEDKSLLVAPQDIKINLTFSADWPFQIFITLSEDLNTDTFNI